MYPERSRPLTIGYSRKSTRAHLPEWSPSHGASGAWGVRGVELLQLAAATAKSLQSCPTVCDPIDGSPSGSAAPGILQARTLEWVAISFSNAWKWKVKVKLLSRVRLLATPWTAAYQAPPSMGFSRQEHWSGVPSPSLICCVLYFYYFHQLYLRSSGLRSPRLGTPALCDHHWRFLEI